MKLLLHMRPCTRGITISGYFVTPKHGMEQLTRFRTTIFGGAVPRELQGERGEMEIGWMMDRMEIEG
jgi:hypothetical protein